MPSIITRAAWSAVALLMAAAAAVLALLCLAPLSV